MVYASREARYAGQGVRRTRVRKCGPGCIVGGCPTTYQWVPELGLGQRSCAKCGCASTLKAQKEAWYGCKSLRDEVWARDGCRCRYCSAPADHLDHVFPLALGGAPELDNLVCACRRCGHKKGAKTLAQSGMALLPVPAPGPLP